MEWGWWADGFCLGFGIAMLITNFVWRRYYNRLSALLDESIENAQNAIDLAERLVRRAGG